MLLNGTLKPLFETNEKVLCMHSHAQILNLIEKDDKNFSKQ